MRRCRPNQFNALKFLSGLQHHLNRLLSSAKSKNMIWMCVNHRLYIRKIPVYRQVSARLARAAWMFQNGICFNFAFQDILRLKNPMLLCTQRSRE